MAIDFFQLAQKIRVRAGFLFFGLFLIFSRPTWQLALIGFLIASMGLALRLWAAGCIEKGREMEVMGPYRYTRNPLYLGSFLGGTGCCVAAANLWLTIAFVFLFFTIYGPVMKREEEEMNNLFPEKFAVYRRAVPLFVPSLRARMPESLLADDLSPSATGSAEPTAAWNRSRFRWSRLWRNREYKVALGFVAVFAWICFRLWTS